MRNSTLFECCSMLQHDENKWEYHSSISTPKHDSKKNRTSTNKQNILRNQFFPNRNRIRFYEWDERELKFWSLAIEMNKYIFSILHSMATNMNIHSFLKAKEYPTYTHVIINTKYVTEKRISNFCRSSRIDWIHNFFFFAPEKKKNHFVIHLPHKSSLSWPLCAITYIQQNPLPNRRYFYWSMKIVFQLTFIGYAHMPHICETGSVIIIHNILLFTTVLNIPNSGVLLLLLMFQFQYSNTKTKQNFCGFENIYLKKQKFDLYALRKCTIGNENKVSLIICSQCPIPVCVVISSNWIIPKNQVN